jgi:hypothetical protein
MATKVYTVEEIRAKIWTNNKWLVRGILAIYDCQTADEKSSQNTKYHNGVGFNGRDANIMSSFARQIQSWQSQENPRYSNPLSPKQFELARRAMQKYAGQLARIAAEKTPVKAEEFDSEEFDPAIIAEAEAAQQAEAEAEARAERAAIQAVERESEELCNLLPPLKWGSFPAHPFSRFGETASCYRASSSG